MATQMIDKRILQYNLANQNYSITLPPKLIGDLGWNAGEKVMIVVRGDTLTLRKV